MNGDKGNEGPNVVPLRTILRNFLNLVENYEARKDGGIDSYESEFQELKQLSESLKSDPGHCCREGEKTTNRKKNRYKDILPYDFSRVILSDIGEVPGSDYINANFIKGASGSSAYIACQGPLPHTVNDFWRMVVECEVQVIVMACNEQESGKHKCENYWVEEDGVEREFGDVVVWLKKCRQVCPDFLVRTMRMRYKNSKGETEERNVCQFHYSAWPDHGVPTKVRPLLDMVRLIRDCQTSETLPVLVHCSAGCGRTGTICAIDYVWGLLRLGRLTADFSLFNLVRDMRKQRIAMVQTKDQYVLVHRAVKELFQEQLKIIDSHPYANVDQDGLPLELKSELTEPTYEFLNVAPSSETIKVTPSTKLYDNKCQDQPNGIVISVSNVNVGNFGATSSLPRAADWKTANSSINFGSPPSPSTKPARPSKLSGNSDPVIVSSDKSQDRSKISTLSHSPEITVSEIQYPTSERDSKTQDTSPALSLESRKGFTKPSTSYSALLRKPSIVKIKSFFEKSVGKDDDRKAQPTPKLSRAKSDVSTRFQAFTASFSSRSPPVVNSARHLHTEKQSVNAKPPNKESSPEEVSSFHYNKDGKLSHVKSAVKRSKSLKITSDALSKLTAFKFDSKSGKPKGMSSKVAQSTTVPDESDGTSKVTNNQSIDKFKVQSTASKSLKAENITLNPEEQYDYDIDDRSHLRQRPISPTALDREAVISIDVNPKNEEKSLQAESRNVKKVPMRDYANIELRSPKTNGAAKTWKTGISKEMEDIGLISSKKESSKTFDRLKKSDTVNPRLLSSSKVFGSNFEFLNDRKTSVDAKNFTDSIRVPKEPKFTALFSNDITKQPGSSRTRGLESTCDKPTYHWNSQDGDKVPLVNSDSDKIYIEAINSDVQVTKSLSVDTADSGTKNDLRNDSSVAQDKPSIRRRVPRTNPYANYPCSVTGTSNFPLKAIEPKKAESQSQLLLPLNCDTSTRYVRENNGHLPSLKPGNGSSSLGNSSNSSSSTPTPRNSLPGTPTQSVDILYPTSRVAPSQSQTTGTNASRQATIRQAPLPNKQNPRPKGIISDEIMFRPETSSQLLPGITKPNGLRIAIGVRERRNSFRQAVWKEAQPVNGVRVDSASQESSESPPTQNSKFAVSDLFPRNGVRNYEPIWPEQSSYSNLRSEKLTSNEQLHKYDNPNYPPKSTSTQDAAPINYSLNDPSLQAKVEQLKSMLVELNAPAKVQAQTTSASKANSGNPSGSLATSSLKQHRSLRAPSRSQYQQGLSCFNFKKPSSYESVIDAVHMEDDQLIANEARVSQHEDSTATSSHVLHKEFLGQRHSNEYVTLNQCRSPTEEISKQDQLPSSGSRHNLQASEDGRITSYWADGSSVPIPPPRAKKMNGYYNLSKTGSPGEESWKTRSINHNSRYSPEVFIPNGKTARSNDITNGNASGPFVGPQTSNFVQQDLELVNCLPSSPKSIITALGLFQPKAATFRTRFANWAESRDQNRMATESATSDNSKLMSSENCSYTSGSVDKHKNMDVKFQGPLDQRNNQDHTKAICATATTLSKHQYL